MKFWTSGETYKNISHETMKLLYVNIQGKINEYISSKNYGNGVGLWSYITISLPENLLSPEFFTEIRKYSKSKNEVEFRLKIDNKELANSNEKKACKLFCNSILRSIDIAETELKIKNFDFTLFRKDLTNLFKAEGWI